MKLLAPSRYIIFAILFSSSFFSYSQGFLKTEGKKIVNGNGDEVILRGMGLGGWMLQEGYMMLTADFANTQHDLKKKITEIAGEETTVDFYESWLNNYLQKRDVDSLAAWGFNSIRLPMHYNLYTLPIEAEPVPGQQTWIETGFILTDSLLAWCGENNMYLILDLHAAPGGQGKDAGISDYDDTKPSLWESPANRIKTVALWKKIAERYKDEPWIGGYDLINETNWDLPGNLMLKELYLQITDSIRSVDQNHILFIEGNWWANDFNGLTPQWDDNMVYSFHKYWTYNTPAVIQWMLDIRNTYNIPVWLGESGENSNTWFRDCIMLLENHQIGWAWWPYKKLESISGTLSVAATDEYRVLLDYWNGTGAKPTSEFARQAMMQIAENLKQENCRINRDVIHAMFSEVNAEARQPYTENIVPGIVYATDYDMGSYQSTWSDQDIANYHISTNQYTAWNSGWGYRNDGVDIESCSDPVQSNGYNVGWINDGEWMEYTIHVQTAGLYYIKARVASESSGGNFYFRKDGLVLSDPVEITATGGWQNWKTVTSGSLYLEAGTYPVRFVAGKGNFNINSFEFLLLSVNGLPGAAEQEVFKVFPNPTNGIFTIEAGEKNYDRLFITVLNTKSQIIYTAYPGKQNLPVTIDLSAYDRGIYLIRINSGRKTYSTKLLLVE